MVRRAATLRTALLNAQERLKAANIEDAGLEAEVLLRFALAVVEADRSSAVQRPGRRADLNKAVSRAELFGRLNDPIGAAVAERFESLLMRRLAHEPTAYITGQREFYGLNFAVSRAVLIPRPETETLVECAVELARERGHRSRLVVADLGTGSGAIAVAVAHALSRADVYATDLSSDALTVASENANCHGLQRRLTLLRGDLLSPIQERLDLIVANPPYVKTSDWLALPPEIRDYEPSVAFQAGPDGLDVIRRLLKEARSYLRPDGALCLEFGDGQENCVVDLARRAFPGISGIDVRRDLAGRPRVLAVNLVESGLRN